MKMYKTLFFFILFFLVACTKKHLKETTIVLTNPVEQEVFHKGDTVFIKGSIDYKKAVNDIGLFVAIDYHFRDTTLFQTTVLPITFPYNFQLEYTNTFDTIMDLVLTYGKRNTKTSQIYDTDSLHLKFIP